MTTKTAIAVQHPDWCELEHCHVGDWYEAENIRNGQPVGLPATTASPTTVYIVVEQPDHQRHRIVDDGCTVVTSWTRGERPYVSIREMGWDMRIEEARALGDCLLEAVAEAESVV